MTHNLRYTGVLGRVPGMPTITGLPLFAGQILIGTDGHQFVLTPHDLPSDSGAPIVNTANPAAGITVQREQRGTRRRPWFTHR